MVISGRLIGHAPVEWARHIYPKSLPVCVWGCRSDLQTSTSSVLEEDYDKLVPAFAEVDNARFCPRAVVAVVVDDELFVQVQSAAVNTCHFELVRAIQARPRHLPGHQTVRGNKGVGLEVAAPAHDILVSL